MPSVEVEFYWNVLLVESKCNRLLALADYISSFISFLLPHLKKFGYTFKIVYFDFERKAHQQCEKE